MRSWLRGLLVLTLALWAGVAPAHEMSMSELELRQISQREFLWSWTASGSVPAAEALKPVWPEGCAVENAGEGNLLRCGSAGLSGSMAVEGVGDRYSAVLMKVFWLDGQTRGYTITSAQPNVRLYGSSEDRRGWMEIGWAYAVLGVEHILGGVDHFLFVLGLLFLVGFHRKLLWTITAFTTAHSLTLALSALELLTLRSPPVEASIALSIVLVAGEALRKRETLSRRFPAVVAFLFGLMHGLGFAGALAEIGLPQQHLSVALLSFNIGVELGQLLAVTLAHLTYRMLPRLPDRAAARIPALYAIGSVAAYWSITRIAVVIG